MASRSAGMPLTGVYFVRPASIAATAAALTWSGVSKSGSPTVRSTMVRPAVRRSRTRWAAWVLGDSRIAWMRVAGTNADTVDSCGGGSVGAADELEAAGHLEGGHDLDQA